MPNSAAKEETAPAQRTAKILFEALKFAVVALVVVTPFRLFVAQPFIVSGASMSPTIDPHEYLVIDKMSYRLHAPSRGDVVIFRYPLDTSVYFIKRIIGVPGETVIISDRGVRVRTQDGASRTLTEPYLASSSDLGKASTTTLAEDEYFLLGDNRAASSDSRVWGPLPKKYIVGRAVLSLFPLRDVAILPGAYSL